MNWVHGSNPFKKLFNKLNMIQLLSMAHMDTYWGFLSNGGTQPATGDPPLWKTPIWKWPCWPGTDSLEVPIPYIFGLFFRPM